VRIRGGRRRRARIRGVGIGIGIGGGGGGGRLAWPVAFCSMTQPAAEASGPSRVPTSTAVKPFPRAETPAPSATVASVARVPGAPPGPGSTRLPSAIMVAPPEPPNAQQGAWAVARRGSAAASKMKLRGILFQDDSS
jgi:hypothetical protein